MGRLAALLLGRLLALALLGWVLAASLAFAFDHGGSPVRADAVVVLEGSKTRLPRGLQLVEQGYAPLLVISRGDRKAAEAELCRGRGAPAHVRVLCFTAKPNSTQGEAEFIGRLATERGLSSIDVVTSQFHVFRAKLLIGRCYHGRLQMVGVSQPAWKLPWYAVTETAKLVYQLVVERRC
jgi:uncharacterized SAM-binding protein YcdF (DUF218 family)